MFSRRVKTEKKLGIIIIINKGENCDRKITKKHMTRVKVISIQNPKDSQSPRLIHECTSDRKGDQSLISS